MATEQNTASSLEDIVRNSAIQIANYLCQVLGCLWQNGEFQAAKASISFPESPPCPFVDTCRRMGLSPRVLKSTSPITNAQFPDCQIFLIPVQFVDFVWGIVQEIRIEALKELVAMAKDAESGVAPEPAP